jgi:long-subunit fatty acid transport protein
MIVPPDDAGARCATGGTAEALKACVNLSLPMSAQIGGRYKFLEKSGALKADIEVDLSWEHWGVHCDGSDSKCTSPGDYVVVVDAVANGITLKDSLIRHGLQDVYGVRVGGSYHLPAGGNEVILRGGVAYDTAAAQTGWLRADLDGAARTTLTAGAGYHLSRWEFNVGGGVILEGSPSNAGTCDPTAAKMGCDGSGTDTPVGGRVGPDPINPILSSDFQAQKPVNQGDFKSHYVMFMLGASTWF